MKTISKIADDIREMMDREILSVLECISDEYQIPIQELKSKYISMHTSVITPTGPKKRGRKKKITENEDEYIETEVITYHDHKYLLDNRGVVYSYNIKQPTIIGKMQNNGTILFIEPK